MADGDTIIEPESATVPILGSIVHVSAFSDDHTRVLEEPWSIVSGSALNVTVGGGWDSAASDRMVAVIDAPGEPTNRTRKRFA
ncbi:hypothetical protein DESC_150024 [Desulfosarcina cetonica]|nr:hypothetical protein DESC_150024 [Desulfosarcina cetonica]